MVLLERCNGNGPMGVLGDRCRVKRIDKALSAWVMGLCMVAMNGEGVIMVE